MVHIHKKEVLSTQDTLQSLLEANPQESYLVTCGRQIKGRGRRDHQWDHLDNALALSFNLRPSQPEALVSLELGVLICLFFQSVYKIELFLKWPNDLLMNSSKKCGGILIQNINAQFLCGIGLNLQMEETSKKLVHKDYTYDTISLPQFIKVEELGLKIWNYIHNNRLNPEQIRQHFSKLCLHWHRPVLIKDDSMTIEGRFEGIGKYGEALIKKDNSIEPVYTGSLFIL